MGAFKDLSGQKFDRLTAIRIAEKRGKNYYYECICDCGNKKLVRAGALTSGEIKSCGCLHREKARMKKPRKGNEFKIDGDVVKVRLTNSKNIMLCDKDDWECMKKYTWFEDAYGYASTNNVDSRDEKQLSRTIKFHLALLGVRKGLVLDHINRNRLDNRRKNLRFVTQHVNCMNHGLSSANTSGCSGVKLRKDTKKWSASITVNYKSISLGCYDTKEEAIKARKRGEEIYFAPFLQVGD